MTDDTPLKSESMISPSDIAEGAAAANSLKVKSLTVNGIPRDLSDPYEGGYRPCVSVDLGAHLYGPSGPTPALAWTHQQAVLLDIKTNGPLTYAEIQSMLSNLRGVSHNDVGLIIDQMYRKGEIAYFGGKYCIPEQKVAELEKPVHPMWVVALVLAGLVVVVGTVLFFALLWTVRS